MWFLHILLAIASCTVEVIARPINQTAALEPNQPPILHAPFSEIDVAQGESSLLLASAILDDPDVRNDMFGALRVAMTAEHGQLVGPAPHSPALGGVRFLTLADAATMTEETAGRHLEWTGPPEGCAVALQRVKYVAPSDFVGTDAIHVSVSDLGFTGVGGEKTTNFSVAVTVTYKPLPPTLSAVAENLLVNESSASGSLGQYFMLGPVPNSNTLNASAASVNELLSPRYQLDLAAALGTLAPMAAADTISNSTASAAGSWSALGTLAELQAALSALSYHPPVGWHSARLPIHTERLGATLALVIEPSLSASTAPRRPLQPSYSRLLPLTKRFVTGVATPRPFASVFAKYSDRVRMSVPVNLRTRTDSAAPLSALSAKKRKNTAPSEFTCTWAPPRALDASAKDSATSTPMR